jgi:hypothetical protein
LAVSRTFLLLADQAGSLGQGGSQEVADLEGSLGRDREGILDRDLGSSCDQEVGLEGSPCLGDAGLVGNQVADLEGSLGWDREGTLDQDLVAAGQEGSPGRVAGSLDRGRVVADLEGSPGRDREGSLDLDLVAGNLEGIDLVAGNRCL